MLGFAVLFGAAHIPSIFFESRTWGIFFASFSVLSALIFPALILLVPYGFIYAFIIHFLFYIIAGVSFWWFLKGKGGTDGPLIHGAGSEK